MRGGGFEKIIKTHENECMNAMAKKFNFPNGHVYTAKKW